MRGFVVVCGLLGAGCTGDDSAVQAPRNAEPILAVTFNPGTTEGLPHGAEPDDGYTQEHAVISDTWYGDGLAWVDAVDAARAFFAEVQPDLVGFQEIFDSADCAEIPEEATTDFVCASWQAGDRTVALDILGPGYQVMCHPGKSDKCAAVRRDFGSFRGCESDYCVDGLDGGEVEGCGSGSRVGRGQIDRPDGTELTLVNFHGSSGIGIEDQDCRRRQVEQVFSDLGDGEPAANGQITVVLGDLNTDPGRWSGFDPSAARWTDFVGGDAAFQWVTQVGEDAPLTYQGVATIDHVVSNAFAGSCWHAGLSDGHPAVIDAVYFDHTPAVCTLTPR